MKNIIFVLFNDVPTAFPIQKKKIYLNTGIQDCHLN